MSTEIHQSDSLVLTNYWGGIKDGHRLQITMKDGVHAEKENLIGAVQVGLIDAIDLYNHLGKWILQECKRRQAILKEEIKDKREFEKTIFKEIVNIDSALIFNQPLVAEFIAKFAPVSKGHDYE